jgi:hypothetical protein
MLLSRSRIAALGAVILVTVAACGGAAPSGVATLQTDAPGAALSGSPAPSMDPDTAQLEFARCMREHGVDMPDPGPANGPIAVGGTGADIEKIQEAQEACAHFLEGAFGKPAEVDPETLDKLVEFASCMRDHGVDFPDPVAQSGGGVSIQVGGPGEGGIDPGSDTFQEAQEACQPVLGTDGPVFGFGPEGGSGSGPGVVTGPSVNISPVEPAQSPNP